MRYPGYTCLQRPLAHEQAPPCFYLWLPIVAVSQFRQSISSFIGLATYLVFINFDVVSRFCTQTP